MTKFSFAVSICLTFFVVFDTPVSSCSICDTPKPLENVSYLKPSDQISENNNQSIRSPDKGNDGIYDTNMQHGYCQHTDLHESPWWEVDLEKLHCVSQVNITNRADCCPDRAKNVEISVATEHGNWSVVAYYDGIMGAILNATFDPVEARYVRLTLRNANSYMQFCEIEVFGFN